jgi:DNA-binding transcriptional LysR family regulator
MAAPAWRVYLSRAADALRSTRETEIGTLALDDRIDGSDGTAILVADPGALSHLELKSLRYFVAVAEAGGFRRASQLHGILQSVLSRKVRELEDGLGVSLFERHREGVRLTNAGRRFLEEVRGIFAHLERATTSMSAAGSAGEGRLNVGVACSISAGYLHQLLRSWREQHPSVSVIMRDATPRELIESVVQRHLDVTFITGCAVPSGCDMEKLWTDRIFLAVSADNPVSTRTSVTMAEIAAEKFIVNQGNFGLEIRDFLIKRLSDLGVSPTVEVFDVGREVLFTMAGLGFGCTTAATLETGVAYPNVVYVPIRDVELPFNAVWSPANDNPALRRFLSLARALSRTWPDPF